MPDKLYKYYSVNKNTFSCLINKYVWYSSPNDFNDPYDTAILDNEFLRSINFNKEKIFCLSAIKDSFLMWSHYADSHKGFCLEFTDFTDDELQELKVRGIFPVDAPNDKLTSLRSAKPVRYKSTSELNDLAKGFPTNEKDFRKQFEESKALGNSKVLQDFIHDSSFIKHADWAYEMEYRIINIAKNMVYPPGNITGIFFGLRMPAEEKRSIGMILNPDGYGNCKLYQMFRRKGQFALESRQFDFKEDLEEMHLKFNS